MRSQRKNLVFWFFTFDRGFVLLYELGVHGVVGQLLAFVLPIKPCAPVFSLFLRNWLASGGLAVNADALWLLTSRTPPYDVTSQRTPAWEASGDEAVGGQCFCVVLLPGQDWGERWNQKRRKPHGNQLAKQAREGLISDRTYQRNFISELHRKLERILKALLDRVPSAITRPRIVTWKQDRHEQAKNSKLWSRNLKCLLDKCSYQSVTQTYSEKKSEFSRQEWNLLPFLAFVRHVCSSQIGGQFAWGELFEQERTRQAQMDVLWRNLMSTKWCTFCLEENDPFCNYLTLVFIPYFRLC